ncbi:hypothetical protein BN903_1 [Halorubrum sp. AJ67]|nr:hypothetical protein BN903_1 [Halorubrum sp. AJ67]
MAGHTHTSPGVPREELARLLVSHVGRRRGDRADVAERVRLLLADEHLEPATVGRPRPAGVLASARLFDHTPRTDGSPNGVSRVLTAAKFARTGSGRTSAGLLGDVIERSARTATAAIPRENGPLPE